MVNEGERLATVEARLAAAAEERARTSKDILSIEKALDEVKLDAKETRQDVGAIKVDIATARTNQTWEIEALKRIEGKVDGLGHHSEISGHQHIMHNGSVQKVAVLGGGGLGGAGAVVWAIGRMLGWW